MIKANKYLGVLVLFFGVLNNSIAQDQYVFNSSGGYVETAKISILSSFGESITSVGVDLENGFLSSRIGFFDFTGEADYYGLYPNPSTDKIVVKVGSDSELYVFNSLGQLTLQKKIFKGENPINISNFSRGVYFLKVKGLDIDVKGSKLLKL